MNICRGFGKRKSIGRMTKGRNFFGRKKYWRHKLMLMLRLIMMSWRP